MHDRLLMAVDGAIEGNALVCFIQHTIAGSLIGLTPPRLC